MAEIKPGVHLWPSEDCLLEGLCKQLLTHHKEELDEVVVILPTQRLITVLIAMIAKKLGGFRPPRLYTLEQFISKYGSEHTKDLHAVSDLVEELLIASLIREKQYKHLALGHEHELKQFFNDLREHGLEKLGFERIHQVLQEDCYRDSEHIASLVSRLDEIEDLFKRLTEKFLANSCVSPNQKLALQAGILMEQVFVSPRLPMGWLYLACFTTVKTDLRPLLALLSQKQNCSVWFSKPPAILSSINPLGELIASVDSRILSGEEISVDSKAVAKKVCIRSSNSLMGEVAGAIALTEQYIAAGCPSSQIAILLSHEGRYAKILRSFIHLKGLDSNLAVSTSLSQSSLGAWVVNVSKLVSQAPTSHQGSLLKALCFHPITIKYLAGFLADKSTPEEVGKSLQYALGTTSFEAADLSLQQIMQELRDPKMQAVFIKLIEPMQRLIEMSDPLNGFARRYQLSIWCQELDQLLSSFGIWSAAYGEDEGVAHSSISALADLIDALIEASEYADPSLSAIEFWDLLSTKLMSLETRSVGYPLKGVQVLSLIEARYIPFQVVIILGCIEGQCPKGLPKDHLVDDWFKTKMGLPAWLYVEALEDTTFHLLKGRVPRLELFYPIEVDGEPAVRSRFIEKILTENKSFSVIDDHGENIDRLLAINLDEFKKEEYENQLQQVYEYGGIHPKNRTQYLRRVSASSLESLFSCPYQFLLKKLALDRNSILRKASSAEEGAILHQILEVFFSGRTKDQEFFSPFPHEIPLEAWNEWGRNRLAVLSQALIPAKLEFAPLKVHLERFAWPRFLNFLRSKSQRSHDKKSLLFPENRYLEWSLGKGQGVSIDGNTLFSSQHGLGELTITGFLDRLDQGSGWYTLIDYKRKFIPSGRDVGTGESPQLPLYALALSHDQFMDQKFPESQSCLMYWSILDGKEKVVGVGDEVRSHFSELGMVGRRTPSTGELFTALKDKWSYRMQQLLADKEAFKPEPGKGCNFCSFEGICRRDDPYANQLNELQQIEKTSIEKGLSHE
ncbi:MAG: PD-(D/E)XK nuclease family protein [Oligoflexales bacterium]